MQHLRMKHQVIIVLILVSTLIVSCATQKAKTFPNQAEQAKLSKNFEKNPEGTKSFSEYLTHKTSHAVPMICVENDHDNQGHWGIYSPSDLNRPLAITMQPDDHRFQCVAVSNGLADLILKVEAFGKDGVYKCLVSVKPGDHVKVHDTGHALVCGKDKGTRNK